jgi:hypothetical protein
MEGIGDDEPWARGRAGRGEKPLRAHPIYSRPTTLSIVAHTAGKETTRKLLQFS